MSQSSDQRDEVSPAKTERLDALSRRVEELTTDIGSVLHANTSILFMAQQAIDVALGALAPSPFPDKVAPSSPEIDEALRQPAASAARAVQKLLETASEPEREGVLGDADREALEDVLPLLLNFEELIPIEESRPSTLRTVACRIRDIVAEISQGKLPREVLRNAKHAAHDVERRAAIVTLLQTRSAILQMDYTIRSFREFVTTDVRRIETLATLKLGAMIDAAYRQLTEYARSSNVELRSTNEVPGAAVRGIERELVRAFANLLHNAIKYSWHRDKAQPPWVSVRVYREAGSVCTDIRNWGVPISAREIAEEMIFELGYRGKWSTDRGRLGTGIGLTDARDIIRRHRGDLTIDSRPARSWGPENPESEEYYRQPFVTTVIVRLPEAL